LQEAVFRSRAAQAAGLGLAGGRLDREPAPGGCGLGQKAVVELELTTHGEELFHTLWPKPPGPATLQRLREGLADWVRRQDALDRKRNHFLREFRQTHGFDRTHYSDEDRAAFEAGLARLSVEETEARRDAARALVD